MLASSARILLCVQPQDMRRSFDTLAQVVREALGEDPQSGALYVFLGRDKRRVKVLWWERNGYCLLCKRLHRALFMLPRDRPHVGAAMRLDAQALAELLVGVEQESCGKSSSVH